MSRHPNCLGNQIVNKFLFLYIWDDAFLEAKTDGSVTELTCKAPWLCVCRRGCCSGLNVDQVGALLAKEQFMYVQQLLLW